MMIFAGIFAVTSDRNPIFNENNMLDSDFNAGYLSGGSELLFSMNLVPTVAEHDVSYVALSGHTFGDNGGTLRVYVGAGPIPPLVGTVVFTKGSRNNVVMLHFDRVITPNTILIEFTKLNSTDTIEITNIQSGLTFDFVDNVNSSEQGGYNRAWLEQSSNTRNPMRGAANPVVNEQERQPVKMNLSVQNLQSADFALNRIPTHTNLYDFLFKLSVETIWYFKEYDGTSSVPDQPKSSYLCHSADITISAHPATRALNNMKITFMAFTGF